ncbi:glutathione S-transferase [Vibrio ponticus]|uniref:Glutathione S-transferase n=1 Tax=Vibrio ponticus TaxID=265668 RepID=A0ABX3FK33_9VIBR|nr:glutathione S-transferase [Vibrio ponticus]OLQ94448.1 glutathione S-transferase [Vibrio ponticus]
MSPILYSLHNCPYAIRARFALVKAKQTVLIRSIKLNNKPSEMLKASPKGSVPVLLVPQNTVETNNLHTPYRVLEESLDIMLWALSHNDPSHLLQSGNVESLPAMLAIIDEFERKFVPALNAFACAKRYHENNQSDLRHHCEIELEKLESRLVKHAFLFSNQESLVDIALVPFLRKYARIDKQWFRNRPYPRLRAWLNGYIQSPEFSKVMKNYDLWLDTRKDEHFG